MKNFLSKIAIAVFIGVSIPLFFLHAHQTGASWEKIVEGYKVDVGYDPTIFVAGQSQRFDFNAYDTGTNNPVDFSDVWVRVSQGQQTVFAGGIHKPQFGLAGMTFVFPKAGDYILDARFENSDKTFVQTTYPISVNPVEDAGSAASSSALPKFLFAATIGVLVGAIGAWLFLKKKTS